MFVQLPKRSKVRDKDEKIVIEKKLQKNDIDYDLKVLGFTL